MKILQTLILSCTLLAGTVLASEGFQVGLNAGMALSTDVHSTKFDDDSKAFAGTVYGEYNWKYVGLGASFTCIPKMDIDGAKVNYNIPEVYSTFRLPLWDYCTPYVKAGVGYALADGEGVNDDNRATALVGLGLQVNINENVDLNLDVKHYINAYDTDEYDSDVSLAQIGLGYKF